MLHIFSFENSLDDTCSTVDLVDKLLCGSGCTANGKLELPINADHYFSLTHHSGLEKDNLEISLEALVTNSQDRVTLFSKDQFGNGAGGHFGFSLVNIVNPQSEATKAFIVKFQDLDASRDLTVCSEAVEVASTHHVKVSIGTAGASVIVDGNLTPIIPTRVSLNGQEVTCSANGEGIHPSIETNVLNLVFAAANEQDTASGGLITRFYRGGVLDEIVIRGWDD